MTIIEDYYRSLYGDPERQARFTAASGEVITIFKWGASRTNEDVAIYASLGASRLFGDAGESCEFFIGLSPDEDSIVDALAEVALHGNGTKNIPTEGDTVSLSYSLWNGTKARSLMFSGGDEIVPPVKDGDGKQIWFLQLVPLFDSEVGYKQEHGEEGLWDLFEAKAVPYWCPSRQAAL